MRPEVEDLVRKGKLPSSQSDISAIKEWQDALQKIVAPVSDEEAHALTPLFPATDDECYGRIGSRKTDK